MCLKAACLWTCKSGWHLQLANHSFREHQGKATQLHSKTTIRNVQAHAVVRQCAVLASWATGACAPSPSQSPLLPSMLLTHFPFEPAFLPAPPAFHTLPLPLSSPLSPFHSLGVDKQIMNPKQGVSLPIVATRHQIQWQYKTCAWRIPNKLRARLDTQFQLMHGPGPHLWSTEYVTRCLNLFAFIAHQHLCLLDCDW